MNSGSHVTRVEQELCECYACRTGRPARCETPGARRWRAYCSCRTWVSAWVDTRERAVQLGDWHRTLVTIKMRKEDL